MRLLALAGACRCGEPNPIRITPEDQSRYANHPPGHLIGTYRCGRCHRFVRLTAWAYQRATEQRSCA